MSTFDYRRRLERQELLMLTGAAAGAGAAVATTLFYLGRLWMQRVRLKPGESRSPSPSGPGADPALRALAGRIKQKE